MTLSLWREVVNKKICDLRKIGNAEAKTQKQSHMLGFFYGKKQNPNNTEKCPVKGENNN